MKNLIVSVTLNPCIDKTITLESFTYGGLNRVKSVRTEIGGKGINVSKALKNFGAEVLACGISAGSSVTDFLDSLGIESDFAAADGELRTNLKVFDESRLVTTEINEAGTPVSAKTLDCFFEKITAYLPKTDILILSGSVPSGADDSVYKHLTELAKSYGVRVILDADGEKLKRGIEARPYAVKPNLFEFEQLTGRHFQTSEELVRAAYDFVGGGTELVVISMGADGALFVSRDGYFRTKPFDIECKSTVAAGDSVVAAVTYGLCQGFGLERLARFATAAGTVTASKDGSGVCGLAEVLERLDSVFVTEGV